MDGADDAAERDIAPQGGSAEAMDADVSLEEQSPSLTLAARCKHPRYPAGQAVTTPLLVTMTGRQLDMTTKRKPLDLVIALDQSSSMRGTKMSLSIATCKFLVSQLQPSDRFGFVSFDDNVHLRLPVTAMDELGKHRANVALDKVRCCSMTNLSGGLFRAIEMITAASQDDQATNASPPPPPTPPNLPNPPSGTGMSWPPETLMHSGEQQQLLRPPSAWAASDSTKSTGGFQLPTKRKSLTEPDTGIDADSTPQDHNTAIGEKKDPRSGTNASAGTTAKPAAGVKEAVAQGTTSGTGDDRLRAVILLTDGMANRGLTDPERLVRTTEAMCNAVPGGVKLFTFGYGLCHNDQLLERLATTGNGSYSFINSVDEVSDAFADCFGGLTSIIAQAVTLTLRGIGGAHFAKAPSTKFATVLVGPDVWKVTIPDIYSSEARNILFEAALPALTSPVPNDDDAPVAHVTITFSDCVRGSVETLERQVAVGRPGAVPDMVAIEDPEVVAQVLRTEALASLLQAAQHADRADLQGGRMVLERAQRNIQLNALRHQTSRSAALMKQLNKDMTTATSNMKDSTTWRSVGSKRSRQSRTEYAFERNLRSAKNDYSVYLTPHQSEMRSKSKSYIDQSHPTRGRIAPMEPERLSNDLADLRGDLLSGQAHHASQAASAPSSSDQGTTANVAACEIQSQSPEADTAAKKKAQSEENASADK